MRGVCGFVAGFLLSTIAWGQGSSTINGTVTDASGAIIPGARITATEVETSLSREAVTGAEGLYVISSLRPTRYTLTATAQGFRQFVQTGVVLMADETATINLRLELGSTSETINVEAAAVQVDTSTATLRQVVDSARMVELP